MFNIFKSDKITFSPVIITKSFDKKQAPIKVLATMTKEKDISGEIYPEGQKGGKKGSPSSSTPKKKIRRSPAVRKTSPKKKKSPTKSPPKRKSPMKKTPKVQKRK